MGNEKRVLISELSGRQNIMGKLKDAGVVDQEDASARATAILNRVKRLESKGYTFEGAEASVHLMILHATTGYCPPFRVSDYSAQVYDAHIDSVRLESWKWNERTKVSWYTSPISFWDNGTSHNQGSNSQSWTRRYVRMNSVVYRQRIVIVCSVPHCTHCTIKGISE